MSGNDVGSETLSPPVLSLVPRRTAIVDAQIHIGPGGIDEVVAAMDAIGIGGALLDEFWLSHGTSGLPHTPLPGGGYRPICPTAELAAQSHPSRFAWLLRVHRLDPEYGAVIRMVRDAPGGRAVRIDPGMSPDEMRMWAEGGYDHILATASDWDLPVFVFAPDRPEAIARAARAFPSLRIGIDHCGLFSNGMRDTIGGGARRLDQRAQVALFANVCALAEHPNVALKWGHASAIFDQPAWPGEGLWPLLRRAVDAFGAERVFWESDYSVNQRGESWADLLYGVRGCPLLSADELAGVLGGSVRDWLDWRDQPPQFAMLNDQML